MAINHKETSFPIELIGLAIAAGVLFCAVHLLNGWLFASLEISPHISFLYLPSFLRLANVLLLGMVWGTLGTGIGCAILIAWSPDNLFLSVANGTIAAGSAALSVFLMRVMQKRPLSLVRLSDLIALAVFYALLNALVHHAMWSVLDPTQLITPYQLFFMMVGDLNGAVLGALGLRWLAKNTQMVSLARQRVAQAPVEDDSRPPIR
jgi:hypothetical protein